MKIKRTSIAGREPGMRTVVSTDLLVTWWPPVLWSIAIVVVSSLPGSAIRLPSIQFIDKFAHFLEFGLLSFLVLRGWGKIRGRKRAFFFGVLYSILFAFSDEVHQFYVPGRIVDPFDFLANCAGILASAWLLWKRRLLHLEE